MKSEILNFNLYFVNLINSIGHDKVIEKYPLMIFMFISQLAYQSPMTIRNILGKVLHTNYEFIEQDGVQCLYVEFDTYNILAFRGVETNSIADLLASFAFTSTKFYNVDAHTGFVKSIKRILPKVMNILSKNKNPTYYTGHSMGAALSGLLCLLVPSDKTYLFGTPKFIDKKMKHNNSITRINNGNDFVTKLPPFLYKHTGQLQVLKTNDCCITAHRAYSYIKSILEYYNVNIT